jgi:hypothetical protein
VRELQLAGSDDRPALLFNHIVDLALSSTLLPSSAAPWILVAFFGLSAVALWALFRQWQQKGLPHSLVTDDAGDQPFLELVGGARILANYSAPLARLRVWERGISLSAPGATASVTWPEISRAILIKPALVPIGFGVAFHAKGYGLPLVYWGHRDECLQVLDICEQRGVQVERKGRMRV